MDEVEIRAVGVCTGVSRPPSKTQTKLLSSKVVTLSPEFVCVFVGTITIKKDQNACFTRAQNSNE